MQWNKGKLLRYGNTFNSDLYHHNDNKGEQGFNGPPGLSGLPGAPGMKGERGLKGEPAFVQADIIVGAKGEPGFIGDDGPMVSLLLYIKS